MNAESLKDKFDKKFPEAKKLREIELRRAARELFNKSSVGKAASVIYLIIALISIFVYWGFFDVSVFLAIILAVITWFIITFIFDKILIRLSGVEKMVAKMNDEEIESSGKRLKETLKEKGVSMDDFLK